MAPHTRAERAEPAPAATAAARVGVVLLICRQEEEELTAACIRSLQASDHPALELVLVDNGAPERAVARLAAEFPAVQLLRAGGNTGFTGGNNRGIEHCLREGHDYVLLLNNDTVVEPACIGELLRCAAAADDVGAVGGKIVYHDAPERIWFGGGVLSRTRALGLHRRQGERDDRAAAEAVEEVSFLTGCCMLLPARVLREVGGFAEDFFIYVEDAELSLRLRQAGYRLLYQPAARLAHKVPLEEPPIPPHKIVLRDRNRRRLARRRLGAADRARFAAFFYSTRLVHLLRYVAAGDRARAAAVWRGMREP